MEPESPALASPFSGHVGVKPEAADTAASDSMSCCGATLVVCPLVAVIQWRQEIARFTAAGTVKVRPLASSVTIGHMWLGACSGPAIENRQQLCHKLTNVHFWCCM